MGKKQLYLPVIIGFFAIALSYGNTLYSSWHFDDYSAIVFNPNLHLTELSFSSIVKSFTASPIRDGVYRPLANFTFALNWYFSPANVLGFHVVNLFIHFCSFTVLYLTILELLSLPALAPSYKDNRIVVAGFSSLLWALLPIHVQAVTYIVQRMASLSGLFYVLSLFLYLRGRRALSKGLKCSYFGGALTCFFCALGSKENAITLPIALVLMEFVFFRENFVTFIRSHRNKLTIVVLTVVAVVSALLYPYLQSLLSGYAIRPFSLAERLMTESRVVVCYLSQIFYPAVDRFSIVHNVEISRNLSSPWTTLPAFLLILMLLASAAFFVRRWLFFAFAIFFFFLNHIIESTIVPLELFAEHRNYVPSMFLFVPILSLTKQKIDTFSSGKIYRWKLSTLVFGFLTVLLMFSTFTRNLDWRSEWTLWQDAFRKAPNTFRTTYNMAVLLQQNGDHEAAHQFFLRAKDLSGTASIPSFALSSAYDGIGSLYYDEGDFDKAITYFQNAKEAHFDYEPPHLHLAESYLKTGDTGAAQGELEILLGSKPGNSYYNFLMGMSLLKSSHYEKAYPFLLKAEKIAPATAEYVLSLAFISKKIAGYDEAAKYLVDYWRVSSADIVSVRPRVAFLIQAMLLEIYILKNDIAAIKQSRDEIFAHFSESEIRDFVQKHSLADIDINLFDKQVVVPYLW